MSLQSALSVALSGLRVANSGIGLAARNIANAQTPGYTAKVQYNVSTLSGGVSTGVSPGEIQRDVNIFLQQQLRTEVAIGAQVDVRADFLSRLDQLLGRPGEPNALDTILNGMDTAFQALTTSPEDIAAQGTVLNQAQTLANQLNNLSNEIQAMRQEAEVGIANAVSEANIALSQIAQLNTEIRARFDAPDGIADLQDRRDGFIDQLSQLMDIRVVEDDRGSVRVFTAAGNLLVDSTAASLSFDERSGLDATAVYSDVESERGVGTVSLAGFGGTDLDLFREGEFRAGRIEALRELRDETLVQAQAQLDELAHALALSMSQAQVAGTAVTSGTQSGFDIDLADLAAGNTLSVTVTQGGNTQTFTFVRVDDPATLPLGDDATADPGDTVIGIDFSGGLAGAAAAMDAALDAALGVDVSVTNPSGTTVQILNDVAATVSIDAADATVTPTANQDAGLQLALFGDGLAGLPYTGSLDGGGQKAGFAARISVNSAIVSDPSLLVSYSTSPPTGSGDPARPLELLARFSSTSFTFSASTGIGSTNSPVQTSVREFGQRILNFQGQQSALAETSQEAQSIVVGALYDRFQDDVAVNVDDELARLTELQNVYAANARVMSVVQELMDILIRI